MCPAPDRNFQVPWILAKRFSCPSWIFDPLYHGGNTDRPLTIPFSWLFSISGVTSFMWTPPREGTREREKKLTFKPAIKRKNAKSLILKVSPARLVLRLEDRREREREGSDSWSMRITLGSNLISLISQTEHVRYRAAIPESACNAMYIRGRLLRNPGFLYVEF